MTVRAESGEVLKPCPFCGGNSARPRMDDSEPRMAAMWFVTCHGADCGGDVGGFLKEKEAIAAWNRRAPSPEPRQGLTVEDIDALEVVLSGMEDGHGNSMDEQVRKLCSQARAAVGETWRDPMDKPPHLPGEHHSEDVLLLMTERYMHRMPGETRCQIGHVSIGHWRPRGGNGDFDKDVEGWMPLPDLADSQRCGRG